MRAASAMLVCSFCVLFTGQAAGAGRNAKLSDYRVVQAAVAGFRLVKGWSAHNRAADRDERLSIGEYRRYLKQGGLPARVAADAVLTRKVARAEHALARLQLAAGGSRERNLGIPGAINELADGTFASFNRFAGLLYDARAYATSRGLKDARSTARLRSLAHEGASAIGWHIRSQPLGSQGIGEFAAIYQAAQQGYQDLSRIANGL